MIDVLATSVFYVVAILMLIGFCDLVGWLWDTVRGVQVMGWFLIGGGIALIFVVLVVAVNRWDSAVCGHDPAEKFDPLD